MFISGVPKSFYGESVLMASYLINKMPTKIFGFETPLNHLSKIYTRTKIFSSIPLKIFGCTKFVIFIKNIELSLILVH